MDNKEIILKEMSLLLRDKDKCKDLGELSDLMSKHADNIVEAQDKLKNNGDFNNNYENKSN